MAYLGVGWGFGGPGPSEPPANPQPTPRQPPRNPLASTTRYRPSEDQVKTKSQRFTGARKDKYWISCFSIDPLAHGERVGKMRNLK